MYSHSSSDARSHHQVRCSTQAWTVWTTRCCQDSPCVYVGGVSNAEGVLGGRAGFIVGVPDRWSEDCDPLADIGKSGIGAPGGPCGGCCCGMCRAIHCAGGYG